MDPNKVVELFFISKHVVYLSITMCCAYLRVKVLWQVLRPRARVVSVHLRRIEYLYSALRSEEE
jgi:hypothetical protein